MKDYSRSPGKPITDCVEYSLNGTRASTVKPCFWGAHILRGMGPKHKEYSMNTRQRAGNGPWWTDRPGTKEATLGLCKALRQDTPVGAGLKAQEGCWPKRAG